MFTKGEMILAIAVSLFGGFAIGYSKAREIFVSALAKAVFEDEIKNQEHQAELSGNWDKAAELRYGVLLEKKKQLEG